MARAKKETALTPEERLQAALVPDWEWPYKLPENWCWTRHNSIMDIVGGAQPEKAFFIREPKEGYVRLYQTRDYGENPVPVYIPQKYATKTTDEGDILLARYGGSLGKVFRAHKGAYNVALAKVIILYPEVVDDEFLYLYYYSHFYQDFCIKAGYGRSAQAGFNKSDLNELLFPLPPFIEQRRIVERIESLFAKLDEAKEKAQAVVDSFETRKAAILHKAFAGELTAKWREEHGVGMESWEHHQFSDLCVIVRGGSPRPAGDPRYYDGNIPFMKVADITRNDSPYVSKVEYSIKEEGLKKTRMVEANTLLLTNSGATLGVPAITTIRTTFNDGIAAFIGLDIDSLLFYYYFWTSKTAFLRSINMGAAQPNLNTKLIGEVEIDVPQTAEQVEIARVLNALLSKEQQAKEAAEAVLDQIDLMKKSILARAFRGELGTNDPSEESAVELLKRVL